MNRAYKVWKGNDHCWVRWVKLALFDPVEGAADKQDEPASAGSVRAAFRGVDTSWLEERAAVIIDLPGKAAVLLALALGERGLRPVLAINTTSFPGAESISMHSVLRVLSAGADCKASFPTGPRVAPAFVLDSRRDGGGRPPLPGEFDNRWVLFREDLPSAEQLRAVGIDKVIVVQKGALPVTDLEDVLLAYQTGGLELVRHETETRTTHRWTLERRGWLATLSRFVQFHWSVPRSDGSYGRWVPLPPKPSHG